MSVEQKPTHVAKLQGHVDRLTSSLDQISLALQHAQKATTAENLGEYFPLPDNREFTLKDYETVIQNGNLRLGFLEGLEGNTIPALERIKEERTREREETEEVLAKTTSAIGQIREWGEQGVLGIIFSREEIEMIERRISGSFKDGEGMEPIPQAATPDEPTRERPSVNGHADIPIPSEGAREAARVMDEILGNGHRPPEEILLKDGETAVIEADQNGREPSQPRIVKEGQGLTDRERLFIEWLRQNPDSSTKQGVEYFWPDEVRKTEYNALKARFSVFLSSLRMKDGTPEIITERGKRRGEEATYKIAPKNRTETGEEKTKAELVGTEDGRVNDGKDGDGQPQGGDSPEPQAVDVEAVFETIPEEAAPQRPHSPIEGTAETQEGGNEEGEAHLESPTEPERAEDKRVIIQNQTFIKIIKSLLGTTEEYPKAVSTMLIEMHEPGYKITVRDLTDVGLHYLDINLALENTPVSLSRPKTHRGHEDTNYLWLSVPHGKKLEDFVVLKEKEKRGKDVEENPDLPKFVIYGNDPSGKFNGKDIRFNYGREWNLFTRFAKKKPGEKLTWRELAGIKEGENNRGEMEKALMNFRNLRRFEEDPENPVIFVETGSKSNPQFMVNAVVEIQQKEKR